MAQKTGPGGTARSPSTSVWSDEGVRHSITVRGRANRVPSSRRRTAGKPAGTAQVRLVHPRASKGSSRRRICGLPATSTRGLGIAIPVVASREPSPPARIRPCTLGEDPFDLGEARDARRAAGPRRLRPVRRGKPARAHAEPGGRDRKSTRLNSSHITISYAVFCLKKKKYAPRAEAASDVASRV